MRKPHEFYHTHQSSGPTWHYEPDTSSHFRRSHFRSRRGRVITRRGTPKTYYALMALLLMLCAFILVRAFIDFV